MPEPDGKRVALVTGAAGGIGTAIAERLAAEGATVAVNDLAETPALTGLAERIGGLPVAADVSDPEAVGALIETVRQALGPVDVLVANAAHYYMQSFVGRDEAEWWRELNTNLSGTLALVRGVLPEMRRAGAGTIAIVSSFWGVTGWPRASGYSASKAALISLTRSLAAELGPDGIHVGCILPGLIDTPAIAAEAADAGVSVAEVQRAYLEQIPLARIGTPEDVAAVVSAIAGPAGAALSGHAVNASGGILRGSQ